MKQMKQLPQTVESCEKCPYSRYEEDIRHRTCALINGLLVDKMVPMSGIAAKCPLKEKK